MITHLKAQAPFNAKLRIVDPFAGSGTLLFEGLSQTLPNLTRAYSWLHFKSAPKLFKSESWRKNYRWFATQNSIEAIGFDIDEKSVQNAQHNQIDFQKIFSLEQLNLNFKVQNSAELKLDNPDNKNTWIITNPPYGIRMADDQAKNTLEKLENGVNGIIVIHPEKWKFNFKKLKMAHQQEFSNQGLNLKLSIFTV